MRVPRFTDADPLECTSLLELNPYLYVLSDPVNRTDPSGLGFTITINLTTLVVTAGVGAALVAIALPAIQTGYHIKELIDISDYASTLRKGLDAGWLPPDQYEYDFHVMRGLAFLTLGSIGSSALEAAKEAVTSFGPGQLYSYIELFGYARDVFGWAEIEEDGTVTVQGRIGNATIISAAVRYNRAKALGDLHHLIPKAALARLKYIRKNLVGVEKNLHVGKTGLHSRLSKIGYDKLRPRRGHTTRDIINSYTPPPDPRQQYLDELGEAYKKLESEFAPAYDGISFWYKYARLSIQPSDLII